MLILKKIFACFSIFLFGGGSLYCFHQAFQVAKSVGIVTMLDMLSLTALGVVSFVFGYHMCVSFGEIFVKEEE